MSGIFELIFIRPQKGQARFKPVSCIALGDHAVMDGLPLLTAKMTESELDNTIDYLIGELEKIRKKAKRKYKESMQIENTDKERANH